MWAIPGHDNYLVENQERHFNVISQVTMLTAVASSELLMIYKCMLSYNFHKFETAIEKSHQLANLPQWLSIVGLSTGWGGWGGT